MQAKDEEKFVETTQHPNGKRVIKEPKSLSHRHYRKDVILKSMLRRCRSYFKDGFVSWAATNDEKRFQPTEENIIMYLKSL